MTTSSHFLEKLTRIQERYEALNAQLASLEPLSSDMLAKLSKERSDISPLIEAIEAFQEVHQEQADLALLLDDPELAPEMKALIQEEAMTLKEKLHKLGMDLKLLLLPKDEADTRNAIAEIRAGTGGDEAALFGASLLRMYDHYEALRGWKADLLSLNETDLGGVREASLSLTGKDVFARLKFESGVHRVQRVPETEARGRVHTSTATVSSITSV